MSKMQKIIVRIWRYFWLAAGLLVVLFVLSRAIYTQRNLLYQPDFTKSITANIRGWYPESRLSAISSASVAAVDLIAEPVYLKVYSPVDFEIMTIEGSIYPYLADDKEIKLGLRQSDGSWDFKNIVNQDFSLSFDLSQAQIKSNQLELILSIPDMSTGDRISLANNWQIILSR